MLKLTETMLFCRADASHAVALRKVEYWKCSKPLETCGRHILCRLDRQRYMHAHMPKNKFARALRSHCCASSGQSPRNSSKPKVVGLGSVGLDYLAQVTRFPKPDEKLRTEKMEVCSRTVYSCVRTMDRVITAVRTC